MSTHVMRTTPFHPRTSELNETGLWTHWAGYLSAIKYHLSEKLEYFAVRNAAGLFDTSPLYKYRIQGADAATYLSGVLARDIATCRPGRAQYTIWCDDRGFVLEDGVVFCHGEGDYLLTVAEPNQAYLENLVGLDDVTITDVSDELGALAVQGPNSRRMLAALSPDIEDLGYFAHTETKIGDVPVVASRTGFTGDLGYELWVEADRAVELWDLVMEAGAPLGAQPIGETALLMLRIEAGLVLRGAEFSSSRFAWTDAQRSTPFELGLGWLLRGIEATDRSFIGKQALIAEQAAGSRWSMVGLMTDWAAWDELHDSSGVLPTKDHTPIQEESVLYDGDHRRVGFVTSAMYSPMVQRHVALARVLPELAEPGTTVYQEVLLNHQLHYVPAHVVELPFYNPAHKTS